MHEVHLLLDVHTLLLSDTVILRDMNWFREVNDRPLRRLHDVLVKSAFVDGVFLLIDMSNILQDESLAWIILSPHSVTSLL